MEQSTTIVLVTANAAIRAQKRSDSADIAKHTEVDSIACQVMRVTSAADATIA